MSIVKHEDQAPSFSLQGSTFEEAMKYATVIAKSGLAPADYKDKPESVLIAVQMGREVGLQPMQALQSIAVINGRPCIWGDGAMALARAHPEFEYMSEYMEGDTAYCVIKRRNQPEQVRTFSKQDAVTAGLLNKDIWKKYTKRMLQMRARGFALRDTFADALKGIAIREEVEDYAHLNSGKTDYSKLQRVKSIIAPKEDTATPLTEPASDEFAQDESPGTDYAAPATAAGYGELQPELLVEITDTKTPGQLEIRYRKMIKEISDPVVLSQIAQAYEIKKQSFGY